MSRSLLDRVREYLLDGDKVRRVIRLLREQKFHEIIELTDNATWMDVQRGAMPVPVAVARLYAYYKTKRNEEAQGFGNAILGTLVTLLLRLAGIKWRIRLPMFRPKVTLPENQKENG